MTGTRIGIKMTGLSDADYQLVTQFSSRLVTFPDRIARHITLSNLEWKALDDCLHQHNLIASHFSEIAFESTQAFCEAPVFFEETLRRRFSNMARIAMMDCMGYIDKAPPAND
jgi:hypothetical protein